MGTIRSNGIRLAISIYLAPHVAVAPQLVVALAAISDGRKKKTRGVPALLFINRVSLWRSVFRFASEKSRTA